MGQHKETITHDDVGRLEDLLDPRDPLLTKREYMDSRGTPIRVGDRVSFRGETYTIAGFLPAQGRNGTAAIVFEEEQHTDEVADEISVDKV